MAVNKHKIDYLTFNTSVHLLTAYENIALTLNRKRDLTVYNDDDTTKVTLNMSTEHAGNNLALINLNAAIIEGTLRQLFSSLLKDDSCIIGELAKEDTQNQTVLFKAYENIRSSNNDLELNGGWDKLKNEIFNYTNLDLNSCMTNPDTFQTLFTLRNATSHGTALVAPSNKMAENEKNFYPYKWQNKLNASQIYINKIFELDLFNALSHPDFAKHFMTETITFMNNIQTRNIFKSNNFLLTNFSKFKFGMSSSHTFSFIPDIPEE
ncbi:hypothetical protein ACUN40_002548 [Proteus mirabilis]